MKRISILAAVVLSSFLLSMKGEEPSAFIVKPYLQIGQNPSDHSLSILWQTADENASWKVEDRTVGTNSWTTVEQPSSNVLSVKGIGVRKLFTVHVDNLQPGKDFEYRVSKNGQVVFSSIAKAPKAANQPYRFIVNGDIGAATTDAKLLAERAIQQKADLIVIPGDIIYEEGLISEYDEKFWPIYNADKVSHEGAPLLRSIPFVASPGNHDTEQRDFTKKPDALSYFMFFDQPLNGPKIQEGGPLSPAITASAEAKASFMKTAAGRFPVMANYSFDYGNAHWTVIDSNPYIDVSDSTLAAWLENDINSASNATWKFVIFHHPGFSSSIEHFEEQHMRLLSPIFERTGVDVVFNGHVHNYQRSFPMRFKPFKKGMTVVGGKNNDKVKGRTVGGFWTLDKSFDGASNTKPKGVIYIVTGAGGQELYNPEQNDAPDTWQKFTDKFISNVHSLSVVDVNDKTFRLQQIAPDGKKIDAFTITK